MSVVVEGRGPKLPPSYPPRTPPPQKRPVEPPRPQPSTRPKPASRERRSFDVPGAERC
ncbi:hypothetical protein [Streptomyces sp. NPDC101206]|uniref:hypothetical protein n=1 Tax=Streptomyces sp. NPDC101206 TaxID=3366128 RepID=UPI00383086F1